jgi:hypothetical protein
LSRPFTACSWEWPGGELSDQRLVDGLAELVIPGQAAAGAAVDNLGARAGDHDRERFHQPPATSSAVTRVDVHVPGPEAAGTVIRIAVALHQKPAAGAAEILDPAHEAAAHLQRPPAHEHPINLLRSIA